MDSPSIDLCDDVDVENDVVWVLDDEEEEAKAPTPSHTLPQQQQQRGTSPAQRASTCPAAEQQGLYVLDCGCQHEHKELVATVQRQTGRCRELLERARTAADLCQVLRQCLCCVYCGSLLSAQDTWKLLGASATSQVYAALASRVQQVVSGKTASAGQPGAAGQQTQSEAAAEAAAAAVAACLQLWQELSGLQVLLRGGEPPAGSGQSTQRVRKKSSQQQQQKKSSSSSAAAGSRAGRGSWAAGTGYGGSGGGLSKIAHAAMSAAAQRQAAADSAMTAHLTAITQLLQDPLGATGPTAAAAAGPSSSRKRQRGGPGLLTGLPWPVCGVALAGPTAWLLRLLFQNDSLMEVVARQELYKAGMELLRYIGASTDLLPLLQLPADDPRDTAAPGPSSSRSSSASTTLLAVLRRLEQQAKMVQVRQDLVPLCCAADSTCSCWLRVMLRLMPLLRSAEQLLAGGEGGGSQAGGAGGEEEAEAEEATTAAVSLALDLTDLVQGLEEGMGLYNATLQALGPLSIQPLAATPAAAAAAAAGRGAAAAPTAGAGSSSGAHKGRGAAAAAAGPAAAAPSPQAAVAAAALEAQYVSAMQPFQFTEADLLSGGHYFARDAAAAAGQCGGGEVMRRRLRRLTEELGCLSTSLPLSLDSSILLAVHQDRMDLLRALLLPHPDTPYAGGAFLFDILLPPEYPDKPPRVQFLTTGQGRWRANPNLYASGKVCLSLLGTWSGPSWEPGVSTLLQVLVSLQSMVFVPDPYFNEPGYERSASTAAGEQASAAYNMGVRLGTASHALLPTLRVPDPVFKEALQVHYSHTGHRVRKLLQQWVHEARGQSQQQQQLKQVVAQVEEQLDRLPPPPAPPAEPPQQQRQQQQRHEAAPEVRRHHELQNAPASAVLDVLDLT